MPYLFSFLVIYSGASFLNYHSTTKEERGLPNSFAKCFQLARRIPFQGLYEEGKEVNLSSAPVSAKAAVPASIKEAKAPVSVFAKAPTKESREPSLEALSLLSDVLSFLFVSFDETAERYRLA